MEKKLQTPSQTVGPFFAYGLSPEQYCYDYQSWANGDLLDDPQDERAITLTGRVFDGAGQVISDAMIEIWQNDGTNRRFGRFGTGTDPKNRFIFRMIKPEAKDGQAPFLSLILFMRGQLIHSYTRVYFSDEMELNEQDEVFLSVPESRRATLIAQRSGKVYEFDIYMQGDRETVFFDV